MCEDKFGRIWAFRKPGGELKLAYGAAFWKALASSGNGEKLAAAAVQTYGFPWLGFLASILELQELAGSYGNKF